MIRRLAGCCSMLALSAVTLGVGTANAAYPEHAITIVVAFAPGGAVDALARLVAQKMGEDWHQTVVVENKAGAGGAVASDFVTKAAPDGYTLLFDSNSYETVPFQFHINYDPATYMQPVSLVASNPTFLVAYPKAPFDNLQQMVDYARANPGKINYATAGNDYFTWGLFKNEAGINMVDITYDGGAPTQTAVMAGESWLTEVGGIAGVELIKSGKVKPLAVNAKARVPQLPDLPTAGEEVPNLPDFVRATDVGVWFGFLARNGTPSSIVDALQKEVAKIIAEPDVHQNLVNQDIVPVADTPAEFKQLISTDYANWVKVQKAIDAAAAAAKSK